VSLGGRFDFGLGADSNRCADGMFEVDVKALLRVQLGRVAWQIEDFDQSNAVGEPGFDGLGMMDAQVVQNQEDLGAGVLIRAQEQVM
jgi:hypothetical protein